MHDMHHQEEQQTSCNQWNRQIVSLRHIFMPTKNLVCDCFSPVILFDLTEDEAHLAHINHKEHLKL